MAQSTKNFLLAAERFNKVAETARLCVQKAVEAAIAEHYPGGKAASPLAPQIFFATLSGAVTAVSNGLASLATSHPGADWALLRKGMHDQFDHAFEQAMMMRAVANDQ